MLWQRIRLNTRHDLERFDNWLKATFSLYGALRRSARGDWGRAASESIITLIFGLLPVWVPFLVLPMFGAHISNYTDVAYDQIKNGELYFLTTALLAPIFYFTFPSARRRGGSGIALFPAQQALILIFIMTVVVSVLAIAASKIQTVHTGIPPRMVEWSVWLFAFSCFLYFLTLTVKNWLERGGVESVIDEQSRAEDRRTPDPDRAAEGPAPDADDLIAETLAEHTIPAPGDGAEAA